MQKEKFFKEPLDMDFFLFPLEYLRSCTIIEVLTGLKNQLAQKQLQIIKEFINWLILLYVLKIFMINWKALTW